MIKTIWTISLFLLVSPSSHADTIDAAYEEMDAVCSARPNQTINCTDEMVEKLGFEPEDIIPVVKTKCEEEDQQACFYQSTFEYFGYGTRPDVASALQTATKACAADHPRSCNMAGYIHSLEGDLEQGAQFNRQSCELKFPNACLTTGLDLINGDVLPRDLDTGIALIEWSCDEAVPQACAILGQIYLDGYIIEQSDEKFYKYTTRACELGDKAACKAASDFSTSL